MSLWVVVGGQYGSEGKGKVSALIAEQEEIDMCVRCGGPNSGHSFILDGGPRILLRQLPTAVILPRTRLLVPAGALVDLSVLRKEITDFRLDSRRVGVDRNAMIVEDADRDAEERLGMRERLSSTLSGVGAAVARRALRKQDVRLAGHVDEPWLRALITDVAEECNRGLDRGQKVLIEGTQGFGLSLYQSEFYPKATSRDTTAAGFLSEVGLSPRRVKEIVVVFRTFPIRVAGEQAGVLRDEIDWETVQRESAYPTALCEYTTVTQKVRRVSRFDWFLARRAVDVNRPTRIAVMGFDYLDYRNYRKTSLDDLGDNSARFVQRFGIEIGSISYAGTGPDLHDVCCRPFSQAAYSEPLSSSARA